MPQTAQRSAPAVPLAGPKTAPCVEFDHMGERLRVAYWPPGAAVPRGLEPLPAPDGGRFTVEVRGA